MALTQTQVSQLYVSIFNRASEGEGNKYWQQSADAKAAANNMLATPAAQAYFGTSLDSNEAFIKHIYLNTLNKTYAQDKAGVDYWVSLLNAGTSRGEVVASLVAAVADYSSSTDPVTKAAYDQFNNRVDVSNYMANTVEKAPANYATSTKFATTGTTGLVVTNSASTVTAAKTSVDTMKPVPGQTFTLTTGTDTFALTTGDDTVTGTVGTLNATDTIIDNSTTDKDTLTVSLNQADVEATIKNIETVNVNWTSNADLDIKATNMTGNTFNLNATGLAFTGNSTFTKMGTNNVNAGSKITGTLTVNDILDSKIDAGSATAVVVSDTATVPTVGQKTKANVVINNDLTSLTNTTASQVEELTISATKDAKLTLKGTAAGSAGIADKLTVEGSKSITLTGAVTGEEIVNNLTAGTLTVKSTDAGAIDFSKINANLIQISAAGTAVTVKDNQNLSVTSDAAAALSSLVAKAGLSNVTTNLSTSKNIAELDVTKITNLNLEVTKDATITKLVTNAQNNVVVKGAGNTDITSADNTAATVVTDVASIDASALTGTLTYTNKATATTGIIGSSTAKNTLNLTSTGVTVTAITGSANDEVNLVAASTGTLNVTTGAGDDKVTVKAALTGKATIDMGAGTNDTLVLDAVAALVGAGNSSQVTLSGVETIVVNQDSTLFNNVLLDGKAYTIKTTNDAHVIVVNAYDKSGVATTASTDLSGLTLSTATGSAVAGVTINGLANAVNTIKGTSGNDTITAGTKADIIDLSKGGADVVTIAAGDSTWSATSNNVDKIASFSTSGLAATADKLVFSVGTVTKATETLTPVEAATAVKGETVAAGTVLANIDAKGLLTASGINANKIDTLEEYLNLAKIAIDNGGGDAVVVGETLAFKFAGNTYVYNVATLDTAKVGTFDVVELTGVTSATGVSLAGTDADTIFIG